MEDVKIVSPPTAESSAMNVAVSISMEKTLGTLGFPVVSSPGGASTDLLLKKKRGRPRKYDGDGNLRGSYSSPPFHSPGGFSITPGSTITSDYSKASRGSTNFNILASLGELFASTAGGDFTPHVVTVNTREDVVSKILSFSHKGPRGICVLSANGAVSNVTIRQPGYSCGILTYEGRFEILSLSGSYTLIETNGLRCKNGGLSVSLAGPDGRVIGGSIAGSLTAASPIQIVVGSFKPNCYKVPRRRYDAPIVSNLPATPATPVCYGGGSDRGEETSAAAEKVTKEMKSPTDNTGNCLDRMKVCDSSIAEVKTEEREYPDINLSAEGE